MGKVNKENNTKQCTRCLQIKSLNDFHRLGKWYQPKCKKCRKKYQDLKEVKEKKRLYDKNRLSSTEKIRKERCRKKRLKLYGLTLESFEVKFTAQNRCCVICGVNEENIKGSFHIDHDHETGAVRDILCFRCNVGLGNFKDNKQLLLNAVEYITKWEK